MALDAETGTYTFDDGPEIRELERMYGSLRGELTGKLPEKGLAVEDQERPPASTVGGAVKAS